jgi:hypothetical protein
MLVCPCAGFSSGLGRHKKEILFHALNIIYRGKARAEPNLRGDVCQELLPSSSGC